VYKTFTISSHLRIHYTNGGSQFWENTEGRLSPSFLIKAMEDKKKKKKKKKDDIKKVVEKGDINTDLSKGDIGGTMDTGKL